MVALKLDKKFRGLVTKVKDGHTVPDDSWVLFLAQDTVFATVALPAYLRGCIDAGCDEVQVHMVEEMLANVLAWRAANPEKCKTPDAKGERRLM